MSSNPQQQSVELLIRTFRPKLAPYVGLKPEMDSNEQAVTGKGCILTLGEIADCLAEAGLLVTPQASSAERSEEDHGRCAPTPSAAPVQISEAVFLGVVRASGDWENWDGSQIAAAVDRARRVLRSEGIEVVS